MIPPILFHTAPVPRADVATDALLVRLRDAEPSGLKAIDLPQAALTALLSSGRAYLAGAGRVRVSRSTAAKQSQLRDRAGRTVLET